MNRQVIVLNDLSAGTLWMAADEYQKVDDWDVQMPEEAEGEEADAELTNPEQVDQFIADRSQPNRPPQPKTTRSGCVRDVRRSCRCWATTWTRTGT